MKDKSMWFNIRKEKGLTQGDIAKNFNITKGAISSFESGKRGMPLYLMEYYLQMRNDPCDQKIIDFLYDQKELMEESKK